MFLRGYGLFTEQKRRMTSLQWFLNFIVIKTKAHRHLHFRCLRWLMLLCEDVSTSSQGMQHKAIRMPTSQQVLPCM